MFELYRNLNMQSEKQRAVPVIIVDEDDEEEDDGLVFKFPPVRQSLKSSSKYTCCLELSPLSV